MTELKYNIGEQKEFEEGVRFTRKALFCVCKCRVWGVGSLDVIGVKLERNRSVRAGFAECKQFACISGNRVLSVYRACIGVYAQGLRSASSLRLLVVIVS